MPIVGYHDLNAGSVLGGFHQLSLSASAIHRLEFGYTRDFHQSGSTVGLRIRGATVSTCSTGRLTSSPKTSAGIGVCQPFRLGLLYAARYGM